MTIDRAPIPATEFNYNIDDLDSGDDTDDDEAPKKSIPNWASGEALFQMCNNLYMSASDPNNAFGQGDLDVSSAELSVAPDGEEANICPLGDIFEEKKDNFYRRGSTGIWKKPPRG